MTRCAPGVPRYDVAGKMGNHNDVVMARCLQQVGVFPWNTRDGAGRERFHVFEPETIAWQTPPGVELPAAGAGPHAAVARTNAAKSWWYFEWSFDAIAGLPGVAPDSILFHYIEKPQNMEALRATAAEGPWGYLRAQIVAKHCANLAPNAPLPNAVALMKCKQQKQGRAGGAVVAVRDGANRALPQRVPVVVATKSEDRAAALAMDHFDQSRFHKCSEFCETGGCAGFSHPARECGGCVASEDGCYPGADGFTVVKDDRSNPAGGASYMKGVYHPKEEGKGKGKCSDFCERGACSGFSHPKLECGGCLVDDDSSNAVGCYPGAEGFEISKAEMLRRERRKNVEGSEDQTPLPPADQTDDRHHWSQARTTGPQQQATLAESQIRSEETSSPQNRLQEEGGGAPQEGLSFLFGGGAAR